MMNSGLTQDVRNTKEVYMIWSVEHNGWSNGRNNPEFKPETQRERL